MAKGKDKPAWVGDSGTIVYDTEHPFVFIRRKGEMWYVYALGKGRELTRINVDGRRRLDDSRTDALRAIATSIGQSVAVLHPLSDKMHVMIYGRYRGSKLVPAHTGCSIGTENGFRATAAIDEVTCPVCLAALQQDITHKVAQQDEVVMYEAHEHVQATRALQGLGEAVGG